MSNDAKKQHMMPKSNTMRANWHMWANLAQMGIGLDRILPVGRKFLKNFGGFAIETWYAAMDEGREGSRTYDRWQNVESCDQHVTKRSEFADDTPPPSKYSKLFLLAILKQLSDVHTPSLSDYKLSGRPIITLIIRRPISIAHNLSYRTYHVAGAD